MFNRLVTVANYGNVTLFDWWSLNKWLTIIVFVEFVVLLFYWLEKTRFGKDPLDELPR